MKMKRLILVSVIFLQNLFSIADTIFVNPPSLKQWNSTFTYTKFADYFDGSSLDLSKWNVDLCKGRGGIPYNDILTSNQGGSNNIQVSNGTLKLIARYDYLNTNNQCWAGSFTSNYTTVEINTKRPLYSYRYGIFEAKCKMPRGFGLFPAYWLWGPGDSNGFPIDGYTSEIDIAEAIQRTNNDKFVHVFHWWHGPEIPINDGERNFGTSYLGDWHTYKIIWTPYEVYFYVDGIQTWARSKYYSGSDDGWRNDVFSGQIQAGITYHIHDWFPRHICETVLQMQLNSNIIGRESALLPATLEVDYVTVRQFFLTPEITVPSLICSSGTAILDVDSQATNITWSLTPSNLFSGSKTGTGKTATITAATGASGQGKITYTFKMPSNETFTVEKTFWVGKPDTPITYPSGYPTLELGLGAYQPISLFKTPGFTGGTINWWSTGSITPVNSTNGMTCTFEAISLGTGNFYVTVQNTCPGTSSIGGGTVNVVSGGGGQLRLVLSPNPTGAETTLSIESTTVETTFDENTEWDLEIYDQVQTLKEKQSKLKGKEYQIQTAGWKEGVYFIRVKYKDEILTNQLVVKQ